MSSALPTVGVVGATGYSGALVARLLAAHPGFRLSFCTSDAAAGEQVSSRLGFASDLAFVPNGDAAARALGVDAVLLATPAEVSARLAPAMVEARKAVIDLSGAFRLGDPARYPTWYGFAHPSPALLDRAHYGIPELFGAPPRAADGSALVANPGCYPTASLLALSPLLREGLIEPRGIVVDAKSGVTGAGRQAKEEYSFAEVDEEIRAYKILSHQHTPEIARGLAASAPRGAKEPPIELTFTPHLLPIRRGILATCYARPRAGATSRAIAACLAEAYASSAFVKVVAPEKVTLGAVVGTNEARVGAVANGDVVVSVASIDNLLKGAAGQAVQNLNLLFGLDERLGLAQLQRISP
ncbi:MAG: N-acetyl-gamma-glutamyl-phosphate reductase [Polyangiaceae bacterium]